MAQTIFNKGYRNVAIFYTNEPYGTGMNTVFRAKFEALGGRVVATATGEPDVINLSTQMQALKAANPQALFIAPNSVVSATAAMKLAREAGIAAPFFGADIMYDNTIISNGPAIAEGLTISSFPTGTKAFKQSLLNEYGKSEQLYAAPQAYDIVHILQIAAQMGATTGEEIKNVLPKITIDGVSGFKRFDTNGEVSDKNYKYDLFQVQNGAFTLLSQ
jgi:branched-chain amino acid transport system substrate-binding protein